MNARMIAVLFIAAAAIAVVFYQLGQHDSQQSPAGISRGVGENRGVEQTGNAQAPEVRQLNEGGKTGLVGNGNIAHFEIGNRNVKSLFADGPLLWLATSGGVIRYDSTTDDYTVFNNKTPGILSNGIFHVSKLQNRIAVGTYGGGLSLLDPATGQWTNINIPQGLADQFVYDLQLDRQGDAWIATWSGVNRVKGARFDDPAAWETFTVENTQGGLPNPWVYGVEEGKDGEMWFATEAGLARYRDGKWKNWQHPQGLGAPLEKVRDAIQFTNDPAKSSKHHAQQKAEQGLAGVDVAYNPNYIISLEVGDDGTVWCGTWGGGLARFDGQQFRNYTTSEGLPGNHIFMLYKDPGGTLWVGTSKGLSRFDQGSETFQTISSRDGLYADNVFSMTAAPDGSMWVGSFGGVARLSGAGWPFSP